MELNKIYNEDCIETLKRIKTASVDLMLTDIPYGVTSLEWDILPNLNEMWIEWDRILKENGAWIFTATQPLTTDLIISNRKHFKYELIWDKHLTSSPALSKIQPLRSHENILVFYRKQPTYNPQMRKGKVTTRFGGKAASKSGVCGNLGTDYLEGVGYPKSILEFDRNNNLTGGGFHPSQKPINLFRYLIKTYTNKNDLVFDGYMGSGTTALACIKEKRNYIGSELDSKYFDVLNKRIQNELSKPELF
jgi:site-specific DNA-methyltransferase (adenine-specific)